MLIYFEDIDQAVNTDEIARIYQYAIPEVRVMNEIAKQLESGVSPYELETPEANFNSTIKLKDGTELHVKGKVKEIIDEVSKNAH